MHANDHSFQQTGAKAKLPDRSKVINAILSDFNHDGQADLLITYKPSNNEVSKVKLFLGESSSTSTTIVVGGLKESEWTELECSMGFHPLPIDYRGIFQLDLLVVRPKENQLTIWPTLATNPDDQSNNLSQEAYPLAGLILPKEFAFLSAPNWGGQADFDGDGHPDLFLTLSSAVNGPPEAILIKRRIPNPIDKKDSPNTLSDQMGIKYYSDDNLVIPLPAGTGPITVLDVDGDGHVDIVFAVCNPPSSCSIENSIHILYNQQRPFCSKRTKSTTDCLDPRYGLFLDKESFSFATEQGVGHIVVPMSDIYPSPQAKRILFNNPLVKGESISMNAGDFDLDSFPDLAVVIGDVGDDSIIDKAHAMVFLSVPCPEGVSSVCTKEDSEAGRRIFKAIEQRDGTQELYNTNRVVGVAFADLFSVGPPGLILNRYSEGKDSDSPEVITFTNGLTTDAFSVRAEVLSSISTTSSDSDPAVSSAGAPPLSVNYPGATFRFLFQDSDGDHQVRCGTQQSQTGNRALQYPSVLFGLGRTSNFILRMHAGTNLIPSNAIPMGSKPGAGATIWSTNPSSSEERQNIFPNSDIIFWPPNTSKPGWRAELQINPGEYVIYVFATVATTLLFLALCTAYFKVGEMREDERERRKNAINFGTF